MKKYEPILLKIIYNMSEDILTVSQPGGNEYEGELDGFTRKNVFPQD